MKDFDLGAWLATGERELQWHDKRIRAVVVRRRLDAPVQKVWEAWIDGWTTRIAQGEPKLGQTVLLELGQPQRTRCRILACEPPAHLLVTWTYGDATPDHPDEVEVTLKPHGQGCLLELEHRSEQGTTWAPGVGAGWEAGLLMFETRMLGRDPESIPVATVFPALDASWNEFASAERAKRG